MQEGLGAELAAVGTVAGAVETAVQLEVDVLGELGVAQLALVGLFPRVEAQVGFQVAGAAETLVTHLDGKKHNDIGEVLGPVIVGLSDVIVNRRILIQ